jgi:hypothetical protein
MIKANALRKYGPELLGVSVARLKNHEPPNKVEEIASAAGSSVLQAFNKYPASSIPI